MSKTELLYSGAQACYLQAASCMYWLYILIAAGLNKSGESEQDTKQVKSSSLVSS